jgi:hypothetical protein
MMKKIVLALAVLAAVQSASAVSNVGFSNASGGYWSYTAGQVSGEGVFSFVGPITVDNVLGGTTDALVGNLVSIPDLYVSGLVEIFPGSGIYQGNLAPVTSAAFVLETANGAADILVGNLFPGGAVITVGSTASLYPNPVVEIAIVNLPNSVGSGYIASLTTAYEFYFDLTLQDSSLDIADMILKNKTVVQGSTLSGSLTAIPEPATLAILALGSVLLRRRK